MVPGASLGTIDSNLRASCRFPILSYGLDEQQFLPGQMRVFGGSNHVADHACEHHRDGPLVAEGPPSSGHSRTVSTIPTIAASAGLSGFGSAAAASRERI